MKFNALDWFVTLLAIATIVVCGSYLMGVVLS